MKILEKCFHLENILANFDIVDKKLPTESWWLQGLFLAPSDIHGKGIFTSVFIPTGTSVIRWGGIVFGEGDLDTGLVRQHTYVGIGDGLYLANPVDKPPTLDDFMNHSCAGNLWMLNEITLITRFDVYPGEELTADYALWLNKPDYTMKNVCQCGSSQCRRTVTGLDWQIPELQIRYANHFSPFINALIKHNTK